MQVAAEGFHCSSFTLQSWCAHTDDSGKLVVLDWESKEHEAVRMTYWQVLQVSGNGSFDHETDTRKWALVLVLPRPEADPSAVREPCPAEPTSLREAISLSSRASSLARSAERR